MRKFNLVIFVLILLTIFSCVENNLTNPNIETGMPPLVNGVYQVTTAAELVALQDAMFYQINPIDGFYSYQSFYRKTIKLMNDIDMNDLPDPKVFQGLGGHGSYTQNGGVSYYFRGTFDGNWKTIRNLQIDGDYKKQQREGITDDKIGLKRTDGKRNYYDFEAFIGSLSEQGVVKNLTIENSNVQSLYSVCASIVGELNGGKVIGCKNINVKIEGKENVGGIVSKIKEKSVIENCSNDSQTAITAIVSKPIKITMGGIAGSSDVSLTASDFPDCKNEASFTSIIPPTIIDPSQFLKIGELCGDPIIN